MHSCTLLADSTTILIEFYTASTAAMFMDRKIENLNNLLDSSLLIKLSLLISKMYNMH